MDGVQNIYIQFNELITLPSSMLWNFTFTMFKVVEVNFGMMSLIWVSPWAITNVCDCVIIGKYWVYFQLYILVLKFTWPTCVFLLQKLRFAELHTNTCIRAYKVLFQKDQSTKWNTAKTRKWTKAKSQKDNKCQKC